MAIQFSKEDFETERRFRRLPQLIRNQVGAANWDAALVRDAFKVLDSPYYSSLALRAERLIEFLDEIQSLWRERLGQIGNDDAWTVFLAVVLTVEGAVPLAEQLNLRGESVQLLNWAETPNAIDIPVIRLIVRRIISRAPQNLNSPIDGAIGGIVSRIEARIEVLEEMRKITVDGNPLKIDQRSQFDVMAALVRAKGNIVPHSDLLGAMKPSEIASSVAGMHEAPQEVKNAVSGIRKALKAVTNDIQILAVRSQGFQLGVG